MIENELQYTITQEQIGKFRQALAAVRNDAATVADANERRKMRVFEDAIQSQLADLESEIVEYERLRLGEALVLTIDSFDELPKALIKARIAAGLSQRALAERLDLDEEQIAQYEATYYASASMELVGRVIDALGIDVREQVLVPAREGSGS